MVSESVSNTAVIPGIEGMKMLRAIGPSMVTAMRMPSEGGRPEKVGATVPAVVEESEERCAGAPMEPAVTSKPGLSRAAAREKHCGAEQGDRKSTRLNSSH